jgi:protein-arginine kinase activator protein McsA
MFLCAACGNKKASQGRKLARVHGLRTWVCASCAKGKA